MRQQYDSLDPDSVGTLPEDDWEYTWGYFEDLVQFFRKAAKAGRHVVFTVDQ